MIKLFFLFILSCDWIIGTWKYVGMNGNMTSENTFVEIKTFNNDSTYISYTPWDTIYGKWYMNTTCDSIGIYTKILNPSTIIMQSKILYQNDTIIIQNPSDENIISVSYKRQ